MLAEPIGVRCLGKAEHHVVDIVEANAVAAWGEAHAIAETVHRFIVLSGTLVGTDRRLPMPPSRRPTSTAYVAG